MLAPGGPFGGLSIVLTKATVSSQEATTYTLDVTNKVTQAKCIVARSDADFAAFRQRVCAALEHGHSCSAECPWMYFRVLEAKPRRLLFVRSKDPRRVQANLATHQAMLDTLVKFIRTPRNQSCGRATTTVPQEMARFLFDGMNDRDMRLFAASPTAKCRTLVVTSKLKFADCSICKMCMDRDDPASAAWTTLPCGHVFHDDCILDALQRHLVCPTCEDLEDGGRSSTDTSSVDDNSSVIDVL